MALINCSECGKSLSTKAAACPHCGAPSSVTTADEPPLVPNQPPAIPTTPPDCASSLRSPTSPASFPPNLPKHFGRGAFILWSILGLVASFVLSEIGAPDVLGWIVGLGGYFIPAALRLRDIGKSGWWSLLGVVPLVQIGLFYFLFCAPTGYAQHHTPDRLMKVLRAVFLCVIFILLILMGLAIYA